MDRVSRTSIPLEDYVASLAYAVMSHQQVACQRNMCGAWSDGLVGKASLIFYEYMS